MHDRDIISMVEIEEQDNAYICLEPPDDNGFDSAEDSRRQ